MCGIIGFSGEADKRDEDAIKTLLAIDVIRGPHSTGLAGIRKDGDIVMHKLAALPQDFLDATKSKKVFAQYNRVYIGHNRYATKGKVNNVNAHPFEFGDFVGVHNGTLVNQTLLPDHEDFEVDSENLLYSIAIDGIEATWKKVHGAAALVWWEGEDKVVHFIRNAQRPLFWCYKLGDNKVKKGIYWASEAWMLNAALGREGILRSDIASVKEDTLYTYDPATPASLMKTKKLVPYKVPVVTNHTPFPITPSTGGFGGKVGGVNDISFCTTYSLRVHAHTQDAAGHKFFCSVPSYRSTVVIRFPFNQDERVDKLKAIVTNKDQKVKVEAACHTKTVLVGQNKEEFIVDNKTLTIEYPPTLVMKEGYNNELLTKEEFDRTYLYCECCGQPLEFEDELFIPLSHTLGVCGECSTNGLIDYLGPVYS